MANSMLKSTISNSDQGFLDYVSLRKDFPIFANGDVQGKPLVYLDSGASSLKPKSVIDALTYFYQHDYANIHRGIYPLSIRATEQYELARSKIGAFIGLNGDLGQLIFTKGATEALNLVAHSYGELAIQPGDEIVITNLEHHANLVPWQQLAIRKKAKLVFMPVAQLPTIADLDEEFLSRYITKKSRIVAFTGMSNALGTLLPIHAIGSFAKAMGAAVVLDAAQYASHEKLDVTTLPVDFVAMAGHKMLGPTGIGILYGRKELLEAMPPYQFGGDMIWRVTKEESTWNELPAKFEAGTPPIAQAIGLGAAVDYLQQLGMDRIRAHEKALLDYALSRLDKIPGMRIYGEPGSDTRGGVISFQISGIHPHDIGSVLANDNVAMRVGHHCCQVLMAELNIAATCRVSFYLYNGPDDIDELEKSLQKAIALLR